MTDKWFINECGEPYSYDEDTQANEFPNDDHVPYDTEAEAEAASQARESLRTPIGFQIDISLGNEEMSTGQDVASALRVLANSLDHLSSTDLFDVDGKAIYDLNGNRVGQVVVE